MIVENQTTKGEYLSFMIKYEITGEFIENHIVLFNPYMHKALSHIMFSRTFHICERHSF